jgi:triacylglycerol lipase
MILVRNGARMLAAEGIAEAVGGAKVMVVGHSLGAALATYLTYDLARPDIGKLAGDVSGWFFAPPRPANQAFADRFAVVVSTYFVVNWGRDLVPTVPPPPFVPLSNVNNNVLILTSTDTVRQPKDTPTCNHHAICYAQMLDPHLVRDTHYGCFGDPITT